MDAMRAWSVDSGRHRLILGKKPAPEPAADDVLIEVVACGVCRTDLHVIDGELEPHHPGVTPGHQVVGTVVGRGAAVHGLQNGDLVGAAWLRTTCGICEWCRTGRENLCEGAQFTGWDADGGFARYLTVPAAFAYPLPHGTDPVRTAPLLCAGIIGYRALSRANVPAGGRLGIYGFGSSAQLTARLAVEVLQRQPVELVLDVATQVEDRAVHGTGQQPALPP